MTDNIIQGIIDYFMDCPLLKDGVFHLDALGDEPVEYVIDTGIFDPIIRTYVNGDTERQYQFTFGSREAYSLDRINNLSNSAFYEMFQEWVEEQNRLGHFPVLPDGCEPRELVCTSSGYLFDNAGTSARYQIQLRLEYYQEA
jgi:hypothetical protein